MRSPVPHDLMTKLTVGVAKRLEVILAPGSSPDDGCPPGYLDHFYTTIFEMGFDLLWKMHLAVGASAESVSITYEDAKHYPRFFRTCSEKEIRGARSKETPAGAPDEAKLVETNIGLACDFCHPLPHARDPFAPPDWSTAAVDRLAAHGYLHRQGTSLIWTDKSRPAMTARHFWPGDAG